VNRAPSERRANPGLGRRAAGPHPVECSQQMLHELMKSRGQLDIIRYCTWIPSIPHEQLWYTLLCKFDWVRPEIRYPGKCIFFACIFGFWKGDHSRFRRYMRKSSAGSGSYFLEPPVLVFSTILQFAAAGRDSACMPAGGIPEFSTRVNSQNPSNGSSSVNLPSNGSSSADLTHSINCSSIESPGRN
jgi:hypothetical protein